MARPPFIGDTTTCPRCGKEHKWFDRRRNGRTCKECVRQRSNESCHRLYHRPDNVAAREAVRSANEKATSLPVAKSCNKCGEFKKYPDEFCSGNNHCLCKACYRTYASEWRAQRCASDPSFLERVNKAAALRREKNREHINAYSRERNRSLYKSSPEYVAATKAWKLNRAARKSGSDFEITGPFIIALIEAQGGSCANPICETSVRDRYHVDHIMPLSRGGEHEPSNIQILCPTCNVRKQARHPAEWLLSIGVQPSDELLRGKISERKPRKPRRRLTPQELADRMAARTGPMICKQCGQEKRYPEEFSKGNNHRTCLKCRRDYLREYDHTHVRKSRRKDDPSEGQRLLF